jgi:hypothetical protein
MVLGLHADPSRRTSRTALNAAAVCLLQLVLAMSCPRAGADLVRLRAVLAGLGGSARRCLTTGEKECVAEDSAAND